ncbi:hypothetical protein Sp245p_25955 (plasmid) [Azospirillum baldaniorum]|uniref:Uncharacterized protein n=1 Tax=Azospirillum baldaniorum TaxID=1064539 RepID=A0A9P1JZV8_9PROT|nr:hypothetical protein [Azospirillum baldaniorum]AWJ93271.1 hypothetical protein Sp245p_25955 [Azospirillum baldaniorum]TWA77966.1 hypothetical protein FBZ85_106126 [Azospirillum brasilense]CCD02934.1 conserved protein of unknown function [Azospirillum baldaniorum]
MSQTERAELSEGAVFSVAYPFVRDIHRSMDEDGIGTSLTWKPGLRAVYVPAFEAPDAEEVADAMGEMILTVVSVHKPGRFPTRVFFTRQWVTPDSRKFGKSKLHVATAEKFRRLARGFGVQVWRMAEPDEVSSHLEKLKEAA